MISNEQELRDWIEANTGNPRIVDALGDVLPSDTHFSDGSQVSWRQDVANWTAALDGRDEEITRRDAADKIIYGACLRIILGDVRDAGRELRDAYVAAYPADEDPYGFPHEFARFYESREASSEKRAREELAANEAALARIASERRPVWWRRLGRWIRGNSVATQPDPQA